MSNKLGSVAPKERINIKYVPAVGDQQSEVELPHKMLVTGDFKGHGEETSLEERQAIRVNKDTFNEVLAEADVGLEMSIPSTLGNNRDDELNISLRFASINDFNPDAVAGQVPELQKLLALREALVALKGPMGNVPAFRKQLQQLLGDARARARLASELNLCLDVTPN